MTDSFANKVYAAVLNPFGSEYLSFREIIILRFIYFLAQSNVIKFKTKTAQPLEAALSSGYFLLIDRPVPILAVKTDDSLLEPHTNLTT